MTDKMKQVKIPPAASQPESLGFLTVKKKMTAAIPKGIQRISQGSVVILSFEPLNFVGVDGFGFTEQQDRNRKADGDFCSGDDHDKKRCDLTVDIAVLCGT